MLWLGFFLKCQAKGYQSFKFTFLHTWQQDNDPNTSKQELKKKGQNPHLSSRFAAAILPSLLEAGVPVCPDDTVVQPRAINEAHGVFRTDTRVVSVTAGVKVCHRLLNLQHGHFML